MSAFEVSYFVLWVLVLGQAFILREILSETVWLKSLLEDLEDDGTGENRLPSGSRIPSFRARILGNDRLFSSRALKGGISLLLFASPMPTGSTSHAKLRESMHGLWHKAEGRIFVVCSGSKADCTELAQSLGTTTSTLLDPDGRIARKFLVESTPAAVLLDERGRIRSYGRPLSTDDAEAALQRQRERTDIQPTHLG